MNFLAIADKAVMTVAKLAKEKMSLIVKNVLMKVFWNYLMMGIVIAKKIRNLFMIRIMIHV
jgi:hypothetical protein